MINSLQGGPTARHPKAAVGAGRAGRAEGLGNEKGKDGWRDQMLADSHVWFAKCLEI